jgi:TANK binding kinase 1 ubiquitin-like domain
LHCCRYEQFQESIAKQTGLSPTRQQIIYENHEMRTLVSEDQPVSSYPPTTSVNPVFLFAADGADSTLDTSGAVFSSVMRKCWLIMPRASLNNVEQRQSAYYCSDQRCKCRCFAFHCWPDLSRVPLVNCLIFIALSSINRTNGENSKQFTNGTQLMSPR